MEVASMMPYRMPENYHPAYQQQHYAQYHDMRTQQPHAAMAHAVTSNARSTPYLHMQHNPTSSHQAASTTASLSDEANKPSLPSISNLLGIADGERASQPTNESRSPSQQGVPSLPNDSSTNSSLSLGMDPALNQRNGLPPTPPMRSDSVVEHVHSPSTVSSHSSVSGPSYYPGSALNNLEPHQQRVTSGHIVKRHSMPHQPQTVYNTSPYGMGSYMTSPSGLSTSSYYSADGVYPQSALYHQRPLPSNFPPNVMPQAAVMSGGPMPAGNPWEHHHYISASSQASFPSVQERYVCATCKKAFSRPSSLKIHSHSHTGEKPFKCAHAGCGKAFSVRSNMKRHERGCHGGEPGALGSA